MKYSREYKDYLGKYDWEMIRLAMLRKRDYTCQKCGSKKNLQVHHLSYDNLEYVHEGELMVVCFDCHNKLHQDIECFEC